MVMSQPLDPKAVRAGIAAVIARVHAGDQAAARELIAHGRDIVARITRAHRPKRMTEEDLTQEVFVKVFTRLRQYRGDAPFEHWISRIAATTCLDQLRAQRRRPELRMADLSEGEALAIEATHRDPRERLPGQDLATRELLHQLLDRLRPEDRKLVVWFELEEKTIAEIEALTGWNFNFIKMRLFRARRKLKRLFAALPGFDGPANRCATTLRWPRDVRATTHRANPLLRSLRTGNRSSTPSRAPRLGVGRVTELVLPLPVEAARAVA